MPGFQSGIYGELIEEAGGNAVAGLMLKSESWNGLDAYGFTFSPYPGQALQGLWRSNKTIVLQEHQEFFGLTHRMMLVWCVMVTQISFKSGVLKVSDGW